MTEEPSATAAAPANILHVYGQDAWHDTVWIAGTEDALIALRDAISNVLAEKLPDTVSTRCADGEGYQATVVLAKSAEIASRLLLPYKADYAADYAVEFSTSDHPSLQSGKILTPWRLRATKILT
jgi:hypothetical protein